MFTKEKYLKNIYKRKYLKKQPSYLEKKSFSNKVYKPGNCHNLVNGRDLWGNFHGKCSLLVIQCIFLFTSYTWENFHMEAYSNSYGNIKNRKKFLLGKENEKNWPKEETNTVSSSILSRKKEDPCRKQQRLLVWQMSSTISASVEDPEQLRKN